MGLRLSEASRRQSGTDGVEGESPPPVRLKHQRGAERRAAIAARQEQRSSIAPAPLSPQERVAFAQASPPDLSSSPPKNEREQQSYFPPQGPPLQRSYRRSSNLSEPSVPPRRETDLTPFAASPLASTPQQTPSMTPPANASSPPSSHFTDFSQLGVGQPDEAPKQRSFRGITKSLGKVTTQATGKFSDLVSSSLSRIEDVASTHMASRKSSKPTIPQAGFLEIRDEAEWKQAVDLRLTTMFDGTSGKNAVNLARAVRDDVARRSADPTYDGIWREPGSQKRVRQQVFEPWAASLPVDFATEMAKKEDTLVGKDLVKAAKEQFARFLPEHFGQHAYPAGFSAETWDAKANGPAPFDEDVARAQWKAHRATLSKPQRETADALLESLQREIELLEARRTDPSSVGIAAAGLVKNGEGRGPVFTNHIRALTGMRFDD
jgi:hypothetical protein